MGWRGGKSFEAVLGVFFGAGEEVGRKGGGVPTRAFGRHFCPLWVGLRGGWI